MFLNQTSDETKKVTEGIRIVKMKGNVYKCRKEGSRESTLDFLSLEKNKKALEYLKKGYRAVEISKLLNININTITTVKKLGMVA